jgi:molybdopterin molybdotransferase
MLSYKEASDKIFEQISKIARIKESVKLEDSLGRVLADDVISDVNLPPFNNSAMDGFAFKYHPEIREWEIIAELSAGNFVSHVIEGNKAVAIMTGAKLPDGADTVVPIEDCIVSESKFVIADNATYKQGMNTRLLGEDLIKDSIAIPAGIVIKSNNINLAAACGKSSLSVFAKFKIGVFATGDELISVDTVPSSDQIRSSNLAAIVASINEMNMIPVDFGIVSDKKELIEKHLMKALNSDIDILVTTGGVSVGKYDYMQDALKSVGAEIQFWKVNIKPGKPLLFSIYNTGTKAIPILSLPGNPVSSYVNFKLFVKQTILRSFGIASKDAFVALLKSPVKKSDNRLHFVMAKSKFNFEEKCFEVESAGSQSSGTMSTMSNSDCMFIFPEEPKELSKGVWVECIRI